MTLASSKTRSARTNKSKTVTQVQALSKTETKPHVVPSPANKSGPDTVFMPERQYELSYAEAVDIIGGLSKPSKMPFFSWSTSAYDCPTGSKLREVEGSVCANCYACKGCYVFPSVRNAHNVRLRALSDPRFEDAFVTVLVNLYNRTRRNYLRDGVVTRENRFRWHDSGDIQSLEHLELLQRIAIRTPFIDHWLPTKEAVIVNAFLKKHGSFSSNLTVRLSHSMVGQTFKKKPNNLNFSTVGVENAPNNCMAYTQGGECRDCRACWDQDVESVNYPLH